MIDVCRKLSKVVRKTFVHFTPQLGDSRLDHLGRDFDFLSLLLFLAHIGTESPMIWPVNRYV